jgi:hypothetical protein
VSTQEASKTVETSKAVLPEEINDYRVFKEGKTFDPLEKKIHILISVEPNYIVFLDADFYVHWYFNSFYGKLADGCGDVLARVADLEATSTLLLKKPHLEAQRRMLGEALARLLADRTVTHANDMLKKAADFLQSRSLEQARIWYLKAMIMATLLILLLGWMFWKFQNLLLAALAFSPGSMIIFVGFSMGSLGALLSVLLRLNKLPVDPSAGARVHYFEGGMRVLVGAFAGALFVMAVKTNILLSAVNESPNALTLIILLSIVAGASEQLLPNLISRISSILVGSTQQLEIIGVAAPPPANNQAKGEILPVDLAEKPANDNGEKNGKEKPVKDVEE